jgi:hypothetical protein
MWSKQLYLPAFGHASSSRASTSPTRPSPAVTIAKNLSGRDRRPQEFLAVRLIIDERLFVDAPPRGSRLAERVRGKRRGRRLGGAVDHFRGVMWRRSAQGWTGKAACEEASAVHAAWNCSVRRAERSATPSIGPVLSQQVRSWRPRTARSGMRWGQIMDSEMIQDCLGWCQ